MAIAYPLDLAIINMSMLILVGIIGSIFVHVIDVKTNQNT